VKSHTTGALLSPSIGKTSGKIPLYGRGRICAAAGCGTVLSTYNQAAFCSIHEAAGSPLPYRR
jgi:hypothetical protein